MRFSSSTGSESPARCPIAGAPTVPGDQADLELRLDPPVPFRSTPPPGELVASLDVRVGPLRGRARRRVAHDPIPRDRRVRDRSGHWTRSRPSPARPGSDAAGAAGGQRARDRPGPAGRGRGSREHGRDRRRGADGRRAVRCRKVDPRGPRVRRRGTADRRRHRADRATPAARSWSTPAAGELRLRPQAAGLADRIEGDATRRRATAASRFVLASWPAAPRGTDGPALPCLETAGRGVRGHLVASARGTRGASGLRSRHRLARPRPT